MSDGYGCKCHARGACECGCKGVDWTPREIYDLRAELAAMTARAETAEAALATIRKVRDEIGTEVDALDMQNHGARLAATRIVESMRDTNYTGRFGCPKMNEAVDLYRQAEKDCRVLVAWIGAKLRLDCEEADPYGNPSAAKEAFEMCYESLMKSGALTRWAPKENP